MSAAFRAMTPPRALPIALLCLSLVFATVHELTLLEDQRPVVRVERFCFADGGRLQFVVKDLKVYLDQERLDDVSQIGFLIRRYEKGSFSSANAAESMDEGCLFDNKHAEDIAFMLDATQPANDTMEFSEDIATGKGGLYNVLFGNCGGLPVSFNLVAHLVNPGKDGAVYVGAGEVPNATIYLLSSACFLVALGVWCTFLFRNKANVFKVHLAMALLVVSKVLATFFLSLTSAYKRDVGDNSGWTYAYYIFAGLKGFMLFGVIVLIGAGWSLMKPFLADRDKNIFLVVLPLQMMVNVAMVVVEETAPGSQGWLSWRDLLHLCDTICCCAILFPIVWSIKHLREAAGTDGKAASNMKMLQLFREFYIMVVSYIYFSRIVVYLMKATLPCHLTWASVITLELATLLFYSVTGYKFRPTSKSAYMPVDQEDEEVDEEGGVPMEEM